MRAIVNIGPGQLELQNLEQPEPCAGQVRVHTAACAVCATDIEMIAGWNRTGFPSVPGHEWSGVIDAVGKGVDTSLVGLPCVAENVLSDGGEVGFEHSGGYGEYFLTEAGNVRVLPEGYPLEVATLIEPLAVTVRGINRIRVADTSSAIILGDGPVGLLMVMLLKQEKVETITLVGGRVARLALARDLGADQTCNYHDAQGDLDAFVRDSVGADFPLAIEASGSAKAMEAALSLASPGGKVLVMGDYGTTCASFPWNHLLHRELELIGSNAGAGAWDDALRFAVEHREALARLITHRLPATHFETAMNLMRQRKENVIKVVLEWENC